MAKDKSKNGKNEEERKEALVSKEPNANNPNDLVDRLVKRYGTADAALAVLADENFQYRDRHREDSERMDDMDENVVTKEDKEFLTKVKALGTVEELTTMKTEYPKLQEKVSEVEKRKTFVDVAKAAEYLNVDVLADLAKMKNFTVEVRTEGTGDDAKQVAYAKGPEQNAVPVLLNEFVEKNYKSYIPSLMDAGDDTGDADKGTAVIKVPRQIGNTKGKAPKTDMAKSYLGATYKTPGQLAKGKNSNA